MTRIYVGDRLYEDDDWDCEAYGPLGRQVGARCFVGDAAGMRCESADVCSVYMQQERQRVWDAIHKGAREGDPFMAYLAEAFPTPNLLLNADDGSQEAIDPD